MWRHTDFSPGWLCVCAGVAPPGRVLCSGYVSGNACLLLLVVGIVRKTGLVPRIRLIVHARAAPAWHAMCYACRAAYRSTSEVVSLPLLAAALVAGMWPCRAMKCWLVLSMVHSCTLGQLPLVPLRMCRPVNRNVKKVHCTQHTAHTCMGHAWGAAVRGMQPCGCGRGRKVAAAMAAYSIYNSAACRQLLCCAAVLCFVLLQHPWGVKCLAYAPWPASSAVLLPFKADWLDKDDAMIGCFYSCSIRVGVGGPPDWQCQ